MGIALVRGQGCAAEGDWSFIYCRQPSHVDQKNEEQRLRRIRIRSEVDTSRESRQVMIAAILTFQATRAQVDTPTLTAGYKENKCPGLKSESGGKRAAPKGDYAEIVSRPRGISLLLFPPSSLPT